MSLLRLLVDLGELVEGLKGAVPRVDVVCVDEMVDLVDDGLPLFGKVLLSNDADADDQLRSLRETRRDSIRNADRREGIAERSAKAAPRPT